MAYVVPDSDIQVFKQVPLNIDYEHTLYFDSLSDQDTYFSSLDKITFAKHSYQRIEQGRIRVKRPYKDLYDAEYLRFRNNGDGYVPPTGSSPYEYKWIYAFVTSVQYINEEVTQLNYEIDVMQTYLLNIVNNTETCFVDREHSSSDVIGENLLPEPINTGEYVMREVKGSHSVEHDYGDAWESFYETKAIYVITSCNVVEVALGDEVPLSMKIPVGREINGLYCGLMIYRCIDDDPPDGFPDGTNFPLEDNVTDSAVKQANWIIKVLTINNRQDNIVGIYTAPASFDTDGTVYPDYVILPIDKDYNWTFKPIGSNIARKPRNNKLYTAPYTLLHALTPDGDTADYAYEYFTDYVSSGTTYQICRFKLTGVASGPPQMEMLPLNYKGVLENYNERVIMGNYPMCAWVIDSYRAWLAQNRERLIVQTAGDIASLGFNLGRTYLSAIDAGNSVVDSGLSQIGNQPPFNYMSSITNRMEQAYPNRANKNADRLLAMKTDARALLDLGLSPLAKLNAASAMVDTGLSIASKLAEIHVASTRGGMAKGSQNTSIDMAKENKYIHLYATHVNDVYAEIIDNYFDRFGYSTKRTKNPNLAVRDKWTYVKTVGYHISGRIPSEFARAIETIMDKGITFWRTASALTPQTAITIGDYTQSNAVLPSNS